jgi:hypothetical protein
MKSIWEIISSKKVVEKHVRELIIDDEKRAY